MDNSIILIVSMIILAVLIIAMNTVVENEEDKEIIRAINQTVTDLTPTHFDIYEDITIIKQKLNISE